MKNLNTKGFKADGVTHYRKTRIFTRKMAIKSSGRKERICLKFGNYLEMSKNEKGWFAIEFMNKGGKEEHSLKETLKSWKKTYLLVQMQKYDSS